MLQLTSSQLSNYAYKTILKFIGQTDVICVRVLWIEFKWHIYWSQSN